MSARSTQIGSGGTRRISSGNAIIDDRDGGRLQKQPR